ncbi:hypothetical protein VNO77_34320 [Canavalia gladiata]|uniref:Uncharacterized protein n=1 Tax=Canavalia gladiata TaxID=3824 RepID=A0AAN9KGC4_CANGL
MQLWLWIPLGKINNGSLVNYWRIWNSFRVIYEYHDRSQIALDQLHVSISKIGCVVGPALHCLLALVYAISLDITALGILFKSSKVINWESMWIPCRIVHTTNKKCRLSMLARTEFVVAKWEGVTTFPCIAHAGYDPLRSMARYPYASGFF